MMTGSRDFVGPGVGAGAGWAAADDVTAATTATTQAARTGCVTLIGRTSSDKSGFSRSADAHGGVECSQTRAAPVEDGRDLENAGGSGSASPVHPGPDRHERRTDHVAAVD